MHKALGPAAADRHFLRRRQAARLTLFISVDAIGSDLLPAVRGPRSKAGLAPLITQGAFFPTARYSTPSGHRRRPRHLATGADPWRHGIVSNRVFNRSPARRNLRRPTRTTRRSRRRSRAKTSRREPVGRDPRPTRLRLATERRGKAIALSAKARAADRLAGRLGRPTGSTRRSGNS